MAAAAPKRSIFNKPAWASANPSAEKSTQSEIFRNRDYEGILEAERKRKEREAAKAKARAEKEAPRESKRRRLSDENEEDESDTARTIDHGNDDESDRPVTRSTPTKKRASIDASLPASPTLDRGKRKLAKTEIIEVVDDNTEDDDMYGPPVPKEAERMMPKNSDLKSPYVNPPSDEDEDEDDYTRELKRKAREKARLQKLGIDLGKPSLPVPPSSGGHQPPSLPGGGSGSASSRNGSQRTAPAPDGPRVRIAITTTIPDTRPLIVNMLASQSLKLVKDTWCERQKFDQAQTAKTFLTWRGTKLYNVSTLRHILEQLKAERPLEDFTGDEGGIELEAMTEDIFEAYHRSKKRKEALAAGLRRVGVDDDSEPDVQIVSKPKQDGIVIKLVCRGMQPMQLRVRPHTEIAKIMAGFKKTQNVGEGQMGWLVFDGIRLDPESTVEDVGLEEEDHVEVHLR